MQVTVNVPDNIPQNELRARIKEFEKSLNEQLTERNETAALKEPLNKLRAKGTFSGIKDPAQWQKTIRRERDLPYRQ